MGRFVGLRLPEEKPKKEKKQDDGSVTISITDDEKAEKPKKEEKKPEK